MDVARYQFIERDENLTFTVGWVGSPSTSKYLSALIYPLSVLGSEGPVRFVVVGGAAPLIPNVEIIEEEWLERTEISVINSFDVGVMPLDDNSTF
ncbi:MAG: hypothetical protein D3924_04790 [Candidatus Electrothrix sp. AR4]|nr:hypothetical protein [Candidatus Electrothrix sp. AR4]